MSNPNAEILTYLNTAPVSSFAGAAVEITDHWQGSANLLWRAAARGQEAVLKFYLEAGQVRSRREYDGQALFAPLGLAPQPLWLDRIPETLPRAVLVYRWVEGEPFDPGDRSEWLALAQALAQVHSTPAEELDRFSPHPVNLAYFWSVLGPSLPPLHNWLAGHRLPLLASVVERLHVYACQVMEAALPLSVQDPTPVHGDLRLENVLNSFGAPVLLDWEMFGLGDPALEVGRFLHGQRQAVDAALLEEWLDAYLSGSSDATVHSRIAVYRRLLPVQDAAYLLSGGMKLSAQDRRSQELQANAELLTKTLYQALTRALTALDAGAMLEEGVTAECGALYAQENSE